MAGGELTFSRNSPAENFLNREALEEPEVSDVEELKESLKNGLFDARRKITFLRKELKEKQDNLDVERSMRETAEKELANISMNGHRDHSTPNNGSPTRSLRHSTKRLNRSSPSRLDQSRRGEERSVTPNLHLGNMETMIEELKSARLLNQTLTEKLSQAENELDQVLISKEEMEIELEASVTARGAALVDKLYTAQKVREDAMNVRMKLLIDEKEELQKRLRKLEKDHGFDSGVDTGSGLYDELQQDQLSMNEVLGRLSSNGQSSNAIEYNGGTLIERLNQAQTTNKLKSSESFKQIKDERDQAVNQISNLKDELSEVQKERELYETQHRKNEKNRLKAIQNQLKAVINERDEAQERSLQLEDEIEKIRLQFSLKNSLSQEESLKHQFNTTLNDFEKRLQEKERELNLAQTSYDEMVEKLSASTREKNSLVKQLEDTREKLNDEQKRAERSERLVEVLRRRKTISISDTID
eukprot:TCONS_00056655-protein